MGIYLKIDSNVIRKGKTLETAEKIDRINIINQLEKIPEAKTHCASLSVRTLRKAIKQYKEKDIRIPLIYLFPYFLLTRLVFRHFF